MEPYKEHNMTTYRADLPQLCGDLFVTDGGIETSLIFQQGFDLPYLAAFVLLRTAEGQEALRRYFDAYGHLAQTYHVGLILESATWRANPDWAEKLGYTTGELAEANRAAVRLLTDVRDAFETVDSPIVISGCVGPRGDGYQPQTLMSEREAERYHQAQIGAFRETPVDLVTAITMTHAEEAIGISRAASAADLPVVISFTVETDGKLPSGQTLKEAIEQVDQATHEAPAYYMINCAHPTHFEHILVSGERWVERIRGIRANASTKSHAELDESEHLDDGNPAELGCQLSDLSARFRHINVLGGCCGTDHRHIEAVCQASVASPGQSVTTE
jgi:S-methylmethionine-dependent homocysteine/selenocysteine methylase